MVPETLLVGLDEVSAVLLPVLNYALISQLLGLRTCTAWLQLLLLTERVCRREREKERERERERERDCAY